MEPLSGTRPGPSEISVRVDGAELRVPPGTTAAAAIVRAGSSTFRISVGQEARGPLCGMGICFECRVTVDGVAHQRACLMVCQPGMRIDTITVSAAGELPGPALNPPDLSAGLTNVTCDVAVIGAGPAGIAAATEASEAGASVVLLDDQAAPGGQIWRGTSEIGEGPDPSAPARAWLTRFRNAGVRVLPSTQVFSLPEPGRLLASSVSGVLTVRYRSLVLATGARERFLPFPGWTLPGVAGAGGLQALVKGGLPIQGRRVVVAGSGPLLLAVADYLHRHGATVIVIAEQAPRSALLRFGRTLFRHPAKLRQALALRVGLSGVPYRYGCWPVAARGASRLEAVELTDGLDRRVERCDYLACGFGLVPNTEVAALLGCQIADDRVVVDEFGRTSTPAVFGAGEVGGIGGVEVALVEGRIAGLAAAGKWSEAERLLPARAVARAFGNAVEQTFALRPELRDLPRPETLVCRCEDVSYERIRRHQDWRAGKLHTRCGMGPCQGRVCGPALSFLCGWELSSVRPPIFPLPVGQLVDQGVDDGVDQGKENSSCAGPE